MHLEPTHPLTEKEPMTLDQLQSKYPSKEFGEVKVDRIVECNNDANLDSKGTDIGWGFSMKAIHFTPKYAKQFAADLAEAIKYVESNP